MWIFLFSKYIHLLPLEDQYVPDIQLRLLEWRRSFKFVGITHPQVNITMAKEAILETLTMSYDDDYILRITINEGAQIGLSQVKLQFETIRRICGDEKIVVLVDASASHTVTSEAKEYAAVHSGNRIATAILSANPIMKITVNLFSKVFKPKSTYKWFSSKVKAEKWLLEQKGLGKD